MQCRLCGGEVTVPMHPCSGCGVPTDMNGKPIAYEPEPLDLVYEKALKNAIIYRRGDLRLAARDIGRESKSMYMILRRMLATSKDPFWKAHAARRQELFMPGRRKSTGRPMKCERTTLGGPSLGGLSGTAPTQG